MLDAKPGSYTMSKKTSGRTSPVVKSKNLFTRYVDILNFESNHSPAASADYDSVSKITSLS